jgi:hypothetical protein
VVLGYSRAPLAAVFARQDMRTLQLGLEQAFAFFGGVPRELLFDQVRSVILRDLRPDGGRLVENAEFWRFCSHWGFRPWACRPYRAQTKGKVERPVRYVRGTFIGDPDLDEQREHWLETVANVGIHATTGEKPIERFERDEKALLQPLAMRPYPSLVLPIEAAPLETGRPLGSRGVGRALKVLTHPSLLIVDEIGYLPMSRTGAMLFFQLMSRRYEHASTVLTSNKSFEEWGEVFGDEVMAAALIDRLLHHCHIVNLRGNSYRVRTHAHLWKQPEPAEDEAPRRRRRRSLRPSRRLPWIKLKDQRKCQIFVRC